MPSRRSDRPNPRPRRPLEPVAPTTQLTAGAVLVVGATRLRVRDPKGTVPAPAAAVSAAPRRPVAPHAAPHAALAAELGPGPSRTARRDHVELRSAGGLLAAVLSILGGVIVAVVMKNPMFLVFSGVGFLVAVGNRLGGRLTDRKQRRQLAGRRPA